MKRTSLSTLTRRISLRTLARSLALALWLSGLAYGAAVQLPSWLGRRAHARPPLAFKTIVIADSIISLGRYQLNVAFTPAGEPVSVSLTAREAARCG